MLVLKRKAGQVIRIGDDIRIIVVEGYCRLGVEAPRDIEVHREEVYMRIKTEKESEK